ncbi:MAG TPA: hypothetical protein VL381_09360 [Rhodocyclaceae bacterium]|nr:hypothetical protein [Rhodocyclaceae bacterium]
MRKLILTFLMLFLPLQWTAALAADCCLRHTEQSQQHSQMQVDGQHEHHMQDHAHHQSSKTDGKQTANNDCGMNCVGCHAHHCAAAIFSMSEFVPVRPSGVVATPYLSRISNPLPDSLYRPPLSLLA